MSSPESRPDGAPLDGGPRRRPRALYGAPGAELPPAATAPSPAGGRQASPAVCPWLYLEGDPAANADHVIDSHRCELRPELAPDPGHQLAYCLSANHFSCPHLRSYTERRRTGAVGGPTILPVGGLGRPSAQAPQAPLPPADATPIASESWLNRGGWATLGALIALVVFGLLTLLYATPGATPAATANATAPAATANAGGLLASDPPTTAILTSDQLEGLATSVDGATAPDAPPAGESLLADESSPAESDAEPSVDDAAAAATPEPPPESYVVEPGDTLLLIAYQLGISIDSLLRANGLTFYSPIYSGQTLQLPTPSQ